MFKNILPITLVVAVAYSSALLVFMPLSFALSQLPKWVPEKNIPFTVSAQRGTLWRGEVQLIHDFFRGIVDWQLTPWNGLLGDSVLAWQARSADSFASGKGSFEDGHLQLTSEFKLDLSALKPLLDRHRISLSGELVVSDLQITMESFGSFPLAASGRARWEGGPVSYPLGRQRQTTVMPPLQAAISLQGKDLVLEVNDEQSSQRVMQLLLTPKGSVRLQIRKRLLDLAGAPWSNNASPDDIVFKIEQNLI